MDPLHTDGFLSVPFLTAEAGASNHTASCDEKDKEEGWESEVSMIVPLGETTHCMRALPRVEAESESDKHHTSSDDSVDPQVLLPAPSTHIPVSCYLEYRHKVPRDGHHPTVE